MTKRQNLADLIMASMKAQANGFYGKGVDLEKDQYGSTVGCDCPICQIRRAVGGAEQAAFRLNPLHLSAALSALAEVEEAAMVKIGVTMAQDTDSATKVAIEIGEEDDGILVTADEARIIAQALLAAANKASQ